MIRVTCFGSPRETSLRDLYIERIRGLIPFEWKDIPLRTNPDRRTDRLLPEEEKFLKSTPSFIVLDVQGQEMTSDRFYEYCFSSGQDRHFVVGPAAGFPSLFIEKAEMKISISKFTLTHLTAQIVLAEALYRSVCILKNHPFVK